MDGAFADDPGPDIDFLHDLTSFFCQSVHLAVRGKQGLNCRVPPEQRLYGSHDFPCRTLEEHLTVSGRGRCEGDRCAVADGDAERERVPAALGEGLFGADDGRWKKRQSCLDHQEGDSCFPGEKGSVGRSRPFGEDSKNPAVGEDGHGFAQGSSGVSLLIHREAAAFAGQPADERLIPVFAEHHKVNGADTGGAENEGVDVADVIGGQNEGARSGDIVPALAPDPEEEFEERDGGQAVEAIGGGGLGAVPADRKVP